MKWIIFGMACPLTENHRVKDTLHLRDPQFWDITPIEHHASLAWPKHQLLAFLVFSNWVSLKSDGTITQRRPWPHGPYSPMVPWQVPLWSRSGDLLVQWLHPRMDALQPKSQRLVIQVTNENGDLDWTPGLLNDCSTFLMMCHYA